MCVCSILIAYRKSLLLVRAVSLLEPDQATCFYLPTLQVSSADHEYNWNEIYRIREDLELLNRSYVFTVSWSRRFEYQFKSNVMSYESPDFRLLYSMSNDSQRRFTDPLDLAVYILHKLNKLFRGRKATPEDAFLNGRTVMCGELLLVLAACGINSSQPVFQGDMFQNVTLISGMPVSIYTEPSEAPYCLQKDSSAQSIHVWDLHQKHQKPAGALLQDPDSEREERRC
ncbi:uncharacterized protein RAG0_04929 [Rhynchosporium agropyri]|uniref:Heterokaryon incompatibility domain-containing protein n=1 Tax=Rhynchosporium agropyri TaxID=914238 RepID=A0A1E1KEK5_9HELO|nr:uncharacterized protein RAG0_04929 [Rhynchosporium agropyri]